MGERDWRELVASQMKRRTVDKEAPGLCASVRLAFLIDHPDRQVVLIVVGIYLFIQADAPDWSSRL